MLAGKIKIQSGFDRLKGIQFGKPEADIQLTLFLSPSCGHCHKAFKDSFELFSKFPEKIYLNILFNVNPENKENEYIAVVESLLTVNSLDQNLAKVALNDWHVKNLSLKEWKEKWQVASNDMLVNNQIQNQYEWCLNNDFNYTPVKVVNSELLPNEYEISELKYFINDFEDEKYKKNKDSLKIV